MKIENLTTSSPEDSWLFIMMKSHLINNMSNKKIMAGVCDMTKSRRCHIMHADRASI